MKKLHTTFLALLLTAAVLLSGCAGKENDSAPGSGSNSVSDVSNNDSEDGTSSADGNSSISGNANNSENSADNNSSQSSEAENKFEIPTEFTDEDREFQRVLAELMPAVREIVGWINGIDLPTNYRFRFSDQGYNQLYNYTLLPTGYLYLGSRLETPKTYEEFRELLLNYFTEQAAEDYMQNVSKGRMTENPDGTYLVECDIPHSRFIEINGKMYSSEGLVGGGIFVEPRFDMAKIISKSEDSIRFSYVMSNGNHFWGGNEGLLKFERGGWKANYYWVSGFELE